MKKLIFALAILAASPAVAGLWTSSDGQSSAPGVVIEDGGGKKLGASGSPLSVNDTQSTAFQGAVPMTVDTSYAAQRSLGALCTATGNISMTLADASMITLPTSIMAGWNVFPFAVTAVNSSGTTATCTYYNLK